MTKYRKRPIVVEAVQWDPTSEETPEGVVYDENEDAWYCETLEGLVKLRGGEWIVTGAKGEKYPVQDEIFKLTHLPVLEGEEEPQRVTEEIAFAHDLIKALLAGKVPDHSPDGQQSEIWQSALNALCWVLGHDYGKVLQGNIESIHQAIKKSGLDFDQMSGPGSDYGKAPDRGPGAFSLN